MKAAVLRRLHAPLEVVDRPVPRPGPGEVLIETRACGICRTDLHIQDGLAYVPRLPHVPGHEPAGVVAELGPGVQGITTGQRVVPHLFLACGRCRSCRRGHQAQCLDTGGIIGVTRDGGFAEYFLAPVANLVRVPDGVGFDAAGLVSCAVITAVHAYRRSGLTLGDTAVVIGAGGIGLILIQILAGAGLPVVAVSRSETSRQLAARHGAGLTAALDDPSLGERVQAFCGGGAACAFDLVGLASTMQAAAACVGAGGRIVVIGEEAESPPLDTVEIAQRELEIVGSRNGGMQDAVDAVGMLAAGTVRPWIDSRVPLDQINEGLARVRQGQAHGRVVVVVKEEEGWPGSTR